MIRKYPIGLQSFRQIREGEYLYIDKTEYMIHFNFAGLGIQTLGLETAI